MGSGSSKNEDLPSSKKGGTSPRKPVANVNKQASEPIAVAQSGEDNHNAGDKSVRDKQIVSQHYNATKLGASSPIKPIEPGKKDKDAVKEEKERKKKNKNEERLHSTRSSVTALKFEDDSDFENDIDEVLKIPMAESSRKSRDKEKKNKKDKDAEHFQDSTGMYNNNNNSHVRNVSMEREEALPETYAQRLQRQQYKLQHDMLMREKTIVRNPHEWRVDDDEDEEMDMDSPRKGFDASKFRAANKGGETKKELFTTAVADDLKTPRYLQTTGQDVDDVDVSNRRQVSPQRQLPHYNQSEIDLMQQLEDDLL